MKKLVTRCPFCGGQLAISRLTCGHCDTEINSVLPIPAFFRLPPDLQEFVLIFLRCEGKIRDVETELGISYATVCKRLDLVNELLGQRGHPQNEDALDAQKCRDERDSRERCRCRSHRCRLFGFAGT